MTHYFVSKRREPITQCGGVILQNNGIVGTNIKLRNTDFNENVLY